MKKYIITGITVFAVAACISMFTGRSEAASVQKPGDGAVCHQQNQGVIVCNICQGKGTLFGTKKCWKCNGKGILKADGSSL